MYIARIRGIREISLLYLRYRDFQYCGFQIRRLDGLLNAGVEQHRQLKANDKGGKDESIGLLAY